MASTLNASEYFWIPSNCCCYIAATVFELVLEWVSDTCGQGANHRSWLLVTHGGSKFLLPKHSVANFTQPRVNYSVVAEQETRQSWYTSTFCLPIHTFDGSFLLYDFICFSDCQLKIIKIKKNDLQWVSLLLQAIHAIGHCFVAATCDSRQLTCLFAQRIELERDVSLPPLQIPIGKFSSVEKKPRRNGTSPAVSLDVAIENEFVHSTFSWSVTKERCCRLQKFDRSFFVSRKQIAPARSLSPWQHSTENYLFIRIATDRCKESGKPEQYW